MGRSFVPNSYGAFGPRVGFAWDLLGDAKTSIRAGFGIYYVNYSNQLFQPSTQGFGSTTTAFTSTNPGIVKAFQLNSGFPSAVLQPVGAAGGPFAPGASAASVDRKDRDYTHWFNTDVFQNPNPYTYGNVPRVLPDSRGPRYVNLDASLFKTTTISENVRLQLRVEAFNALNQVHFNLPNTTFVPSTGTNGANTSSTFGRISGSFGERNVQLAAKILF